MPNIKIAILGFSLEGKAILKYLQKSPQYKNAEIWILDKNKNLEIPQEIGNLHLKTGINYLKNLEQFDIIFRSPGIPYNLPEIQNTIKKGVEISSSTKIFFEKINKMVRHGTSTELSRMSSPQVIGITGTKGKGTTSTLLYKILKAAKKDVYLAGNIGKPAIELLPKIKKNSIVILELSSFQLQDIRQSPQITVVLDVFEDHLDSHKNFKEYIGAKSSISKFQNPNDKIFYFPDNKYSRLIAEKSKGKKIPVSINKFQLFSHEDLKIAGEHNFKNAVIAATIAKNIGVGNNIIKKVVKNFRELEHRLEFIRQIKNIKFYNDSASTNPFTAVAAIKSFNEAKILICGGKDKNLDYSPLAKALKNSNTKLIVLFGENKNKIKQSIIKSGVPFKLAKNLETAVKFAYQAAKLPTTNYQLPTTIIFSPASASFDMFSNYKERGKKFKKLVEKLK
ncbi:MAG: UDP-N-acetylmuramoyl-L-alanine--D-glutamate ligase [Patescibacteria group bacterium]